MMKKITILLLVATLVSLGITSCGNSNKRSTKATFQKNPVDDIVKELTNEQNFSIILHDMDYTEASDTYKHKYQVIVVKELPNVDVKPIAASFITLAQNETEEAIAMDTAYATITDWKKVTPQYFEANMENMGMELASKVDGKLSKETAPPGYSNYVGNEKYGKWQTDNSGNNFWSFYGRYAFMTSMFHMAMMPVGYSRWNDTQIR